MSAAAPSAKPPRYWPRTVSAETFEPSMRDSDFSTFSFSSRNASASSEAGGSIATRQSNCSMWFCTMSRIAPEPS